jgi:uncharacterized protein (DUF697 family)/tellurite resistance protein
MEKPELDDTKHVGAADLAETTAGLRVLVFLARADGQLTDDDKGILHDALKDALQPSPQTLEYLANEQIELDAELQKIHSTDIRERTYNAAYCLAHMDGDCSPSKAKILDDIRVGLKISPEKSTLLGRVYSETREAFWPNHINPLPDAALRDVKINDEILKYSILNAVTGAFPLPGLSIATDLLVISVQTKLVRDIGHCWGHKVDRQAARSLIATIAGATGLRIALHSLFNLVPVLGSVVGAASSFVTTWALGKTANHYFASGGKLTSAELKKAFDESIDDAKTAYEKSKEVIVARMKSRETVLKLLEEDLKAGRISQEDYAEKLQSLD